LKKNEFKKWLVEISADLGVNFIKLFFNLLQAGVKNKLEGLFIAF
jgi:hypothetical protein